MDEFSAKLVHYFTIAHFNKVEQINDICSLIKFVTDFENFPDWERLY